MKNIVYGFQNNKEKEFPTMVHVETNNICNLRCIHCPQRDVKKLIPGYKPFSMPWKIFKKVVDEVSKYDSVLRFTNDGEPLIHKDIIKQIDYIQKKKIKTFAFNTNGVFLDGEIVDALLRKTETNIAVEVSFDAFFKNTYEKIRVGSDYNRVMRNIFNFVYLRNKMKLKNKKIMVSIIDQPEAKNEILLFKKYFSQIVDRVIIRHYVDVKGIMETKNQKYDKKLKRWPCLIPFKRTVIGYDGKVRFCPDDWKKESVIGDMRQHSIKEIWSSEEYNRLREAHLNILKDEESLKNIIPCNYCKEWQVIRWDYDYSFALKKLFG